MAFTATERTTTVVELDIKTGTEYEKINEDGTAIGFRTVGTIELTAQGRVEVLYGTPSGGAAVPASAAGGFVLSWNGTAKDNNLRSFTLNTAEPVFIKGNGILTVEAI